MYITIIKINDITEIGLYYSIADFLNLTIDVLHNLKLLISRLKNVLVFNKKKFIIIMVKLCIRIYLCTVNGVMGISV